MTESRPILLSHDMAEAIANGARLLTTLTALERAWMLDDQEALTSIFDGIDPTEVQVAAARLHELTFLWELMPPVRGGSTLDPSDGGAAPVAAREHSVESADSGKQPSAPIPLHFYSRKAPPCT